MPHFLGSAGRALLLSGIAAVIAAVSTSESHAGTTSVSCNSNSAALVNALDGNSFGVLLPTPTGTYVITGTCVGDIVIPQGTQSGIGLTIQGGTIEGSVTIAVPGVTLSNVTIDGTGSSDTAGLKLTTGAAVTLNNVTVQNFASGDGIDVLGGAAVKMTSVTVQNNGGGPALKIEGSTADISGSTFDVPSGAAFPTLNLERGSLGLIGEPTGSGCTNSNSITGSGDTNTIFASVGSAIKMVCTSVTQTSNTTPTIMIADGSALVSLGGNSIVNSTGPAVYVSNASTFHERVETNPVLADSVSGTLPSTVQVESNMELGTGSGATSTFTGNITVAQNSSMRLVGGITVNGAIALEQASNGFFNKSLGGTNTVTGGVSCPSSMTAASHVAGPTYVTPAVTTTSNGASSTCLGF